jgi:hypothetical protein
MAAADLHLKVIRAGVEGLCSGGVTEFLPDSRQVTQRLD